MNGSSDLFNVPVLGFNTYGEPDTGACQCQVTPIFGGALGQYAIALFARLQGFTARPDSGGVSGAELYVTGRTESGFEVRARDGEADVEFSYRVVAKRRGHEDKRLEHMPVAERIIDKER